MQGASGHGVLDNSCTGRSRRTRSLVGSLAAVTAIMLFAGACSNDKPSENAVADVPSSKGTAKGAPPKGGSTLAYAKCMREHGISNFPDPNAQGLLDIDGNKVDMKSSQAQAADKACKPLLPAVGNAKPPAGVKEAALEYSKCMRKNGVPKFPDPNAEGGLDINGETLGVDPNGDVFKGADKTCQPILEKVAGGPKEIQSGGPGSGPQ